MTYKHLSQNERYQTQARLKASQTISRIAEIIGRHMLTVSRELTRNVRLKGYRPQQAQRFAELRGRKSRNARRVVTLQREPHFVASEDRRSFVAKSSL